MTRPEMDVLCTEVEAAMRRVWTLKQSAHLAGKVCISASGRSILTRANQYSALPGPYRSTAQYHCFATGLWDDVDDFLTTITALSPHGDPQAVRDADASTSTGRHPKLPAWPPPSNLCLFKQLPPTPTHEVAGNLTRR
ncbi:hypothetical protein LshimejAT787_2600250 [Lyophyllum shimeji]|uniref:Uncharacterized protein n=1 Tax=Lyophyllum shimeji TaxID=47721 RepID=A0A9P3Q2M8_LYOSH|nr:hypothetical protein LshimejAT787_2600250 [Lyophyllum shimeji]